MEILKKIFITNNKRPILLHTESRNDNSSSKINQSCKTNYQNNININNKSSYVNIQNSKIKLMKSIPKGKLNISFCKKGINSSNTNNNEPNKECKLITYIDLGNNKTKKYTKNKKDISQDSKPNYTFKKDLIINNNITNNISNHITNIILTNNNNQKSNGINNQSYLSNKNDETKNNLSQRLQKKKRINKFNKLEKHIYNKINNSKKDLTSRNTKNIDKIIDIKTNSIKVVNKNLKNKEKGKENKTKIISDRNKNNISTYFTNYINYSSHLNNNPNYKNNSNIPNNNKNLKSSVKYKNETNNIELNLNTKKLNKNSLKKLKAFNSFNSNNFKGKLIKFNPSMKYLEDSFSMNSLSSNRNLIQVNDKSNINNNFNPNNKININNKYTNSKIQKQNKNEFNINIKDIKNLNQMRSLFVSKISNSNTKTNKSLGDKNIHNISYINSSVTLRDNKKANNFKEINHTLIYSNSKTKRDSKNKYKDANLFLYKNKIKNKNDIISNLYKNYKTDRSNDKTNYINNTFTNEENSNVNIINIINNINQKNKSYNKSFLANNIDILKNKTLKGQKRKISLNVYKNIKKYFLSKSMQKKFDISNTYINYKNDNFNSYKEQYLYNKANSYRNICYISKEKDKKNCNYTKRKNPKYYSNQKKIHNKKIIINKNKNRCKKEKNIDYTQFNIQNNDIVKSINLKKNNKINIIKNKLLKRNPKSIHNFSKDGHIIVNQRKNENRNDNEINYRRETYNSISMNFLKNILDMESDHFSPKPFTKNNLIKNYNINIRNTHVGGIVKQNKSFKISNPYNNINIISLNKKKKLKIEEIIHNKYKNKKNYNYRNNITDKLSKDNKTNFIKKEKIENKINNKENEIISKSKDLKDKITHTKYFRKSKTSQNNINPNLFELSFNKEIKKEKIEFEDEQNIINPEIKNNPQYLSEYIYDILENFLIDESSYISKNYIKSNYLYYFNDTELTEEIRSVSINWLIMIIYKIFKFKENTLFLTVQIIDRFLSKKMLTVEKTELLILCSLILSSKHEEIDYVNMVESLQLSTNKFTKEEIINMQYEILNELNFELIIPTMNDYFNIYCTILNLDEIDTNKGMLLLNIILVDYHIIKYPNFIISLSAVKLIYKKSIDSLIKRLKQFFVKNKQDKFLDIINDNKILDKVCYKIKKIYKRYLEDKSKNIEEKFSDEKYKSVAKFSDELIDISDIL